MISTSNFFQCLPNNAFVITKAEVYTRFHPDPFGPESIVLSSFGRCGNKSKKYFEYFIDLGEMPQFMCVVRKDVYLLCYAQKLQSSLNLKIFKSHTQRRRIPCCLYTYYRKITPLAKTQTLFGKINPCPMF